MATATLRLARSQHREKRYLVDLTIMKPLLEHQGTKALEMWLDVSIRDLFELNFLENAPFDILHFPNSSSTNDPYDPDEPKYTSYTRADMQSLLFTYITKRATALVIAENEGVQLVNNMTKSDEAFVKFYREIIHRFKPGKAAIVEIPGEKRIATVDCPNLAQAFKVITEMPMRFKIRPVVYNSTGEEKDKVKLDWVVFWFKDVEPKGCWETEWRVLPNAVVLCECPDANYKFMISGGGSRV